MVIYFLIASFPEYKNSFSAWFFSYPWCIAMGVGPSSTHWARLCGGSYLVHSKKTITDPKTFCVAVA